VLTQNATHNDTIFSGRKAVTGLSILQNTPKSSKSNAPKGRGNAPLNKKSQQLQHELLQAKQEIERLRRVKANSQKNGNKQQPKQRKKKQAHQGKNQQAMQEKTQQAKGGKTRRRGKRAKTGSRPASTRRSSAGAC
jgi:TolA-binding protein